MIKKPLQKIVQTIARRFSYIEDVKYSQEKEITKSEKPQRFQNEYRQYPPDYLPYSFNYKGHGYLILALIVTWYS